jgi:hypothetical protein
LGGEFVRPTIAFCLRGIHYSIFASGVYRILAVKWLFPQEKATFDALVMSTSEAKMLYWFHDLFDAGTVREIRIRLASERIVKARPQRSGAESPIAPKRLLPAAVWCGAASI